MGGKAIGENGSGEGGGWAGEGGRGDQGGEGATAWLKKSVMVRAVAWVAAASMALHRWRCVDGMAAAAWRRWRQNGDGGDGGEGAGAG